MSELLEKINSPADLKGLSYGELTGLASEIREIMIKTVSLNGGHLASSLGAVELTLALHRVFKSPVDKIIWDVGHQSYTHKLLTGRRAQFATIRQYGGISGFPDCSESPHDSFGTGHAGTSISAAMGMALARDIVKDKYNVIAVIGDGSLGAGMAFEAINHAGHQGTRMIVVLNDNGMSISPSVGAISRMLNQVRFDPRYEFAKQEAKKVMARLPMGEPAWSLSKTVKQRLTKAILPSAFWEEMGFIYLGPVDGHNIKELEIALVRARDFETKPVIVHVLTKKGKGYPEAETDAVKFHGIAGTNGNKGAAQSYSKVFSNTLLKIMKANEKVVAVTAAMLDGTGLSAVAKEFPGRVFDVGICEQHAVTLAAGMAKQGLIPIVAIYSTFLQRAFDQIIHDVCIQNLPVIFAVDRAGIVGEDGKTHQGALDISFLRLIPNMIVASPADGNELQNLLFTAVQNKQAMSIRYPRGSAEGKDLSEKFEQLTVGKGRILREGKDVVILALGPLVHRTLEAAETLSAEGVESTVVDARFCKPLDSELILGLAGKIPRFLTIEENTLYGGFGSAVMELLSHSGQSQVQIRCLGIPDKFVAHGSQEFYRSLFDFDARGIAQRVRDSFPGLFDLAPLKEKEPCQTALSLDKEITSPKN